MSSISAKRSSTRREQIRQGARRWAALHIVVKWMILGAAVPSAIWAVVAVVGGFSAGLVGGFIAGLDAFIEGVGGLILLIIMAAVPGALVGLVIGLLDLRLGRYVAARPRRTGAVVVAVGATFLFVASVLGVLNLNSMTDVGVLQTIAAWMVWALVPALVALVRYRRISLGARADR